ncbi:transposase [Nitrospira japonica]|uniref:Transposase n=1 Tax=Nitrospira japonica TaxID=1325564 RepID=A0A1W1I6T3_9BACT|nr:transposase [Nitrospira japonica]
MASEMPCLRQSSWTPVPAWASLSTAMICSSVCRFRVMAPSCGAHLSTGALPCQWSNFREEGHIQPGKPDQNAFIERFNRTYRTEVLNAYVFESLEQVQEISAEWLQSYNDERPHDALAGLPPAMYRAQLERGSSPLIVSR